MNRLTMRNHTCLALIKFMQICWLGRIQACRMSPSDPTIPCFLFNYESLFLFANRIDSPDIFRSVSIINCGTTLHVDMTQRTAWWRGTRSWICLFCLSCGLDQISIACFCSYRLRRLGDFLPAAGWRDLLATRRKG